MPEPTLKNGAVPKSHKSRKKLIKTKKIMTVFGAILFAATILSSCGGSSAGGGGS